MTNDPSTPHSPGTTPGPVPPLAVDDRTRPDAIAPVQARQLASPGESRMEQLEHAVTDGARSAAQNVDSYVRVYPWGAILASAAAGLVLGLLAGRG